MAVETAEVLCLVISAVMGLAWVLGTRFALRGLGTWRQGADEESWGGMRTALTGDALVEGSRDDVSQKLAERLTASTGLAGMAFVKITERKGDRIAFERVSRAGAHAGLTFDSGVIEFSQEGNQTRVRYEIGLDRLYRIMKSVTFLVCFVYGGLFVVGTPLLVWNLAVHHEDPTVRWQVLQTLQMVHGAWPPFLVGALCYRLRNVTRAYFDTILANLSFIT